MQMALTSVSHLYKLEIRKLYDGGESDGDSDPEGIFRERPAGEI